MALTEITYRVVLNQIDVEVLQFTPSSLYYKVVGIMVDQF